MARARQRAEYDRAGTIASVMFNAWRDPEKTKQTTADDFNPYAAPKVEAPPLRVPLTVLKMFVPGGGAC